MDRIEKFLRQLSKEDRTMVLVILADIKTLTLKNYDVKPLKGYKGVYRLRKGRGRFVFAKIDGMGIIIDANYRPRIYRNL